MTTQEALKIIKRVNERMAVYERKGLTSSAYYRNLVETIENLGLPASQSRGGAVRLSRNKTDIDEVARTMSQDLQKVDKMPALKEELRKLPKDLKKRPLSERYEHIKNYGSLKKWCDENLTPLYNDARSGVQSAIALESLFNEGARPYDYSTIFSMIDAYEREMSVIESEMMGNSFYPFDN